MARIGKTFHVYPQTVTLTEGMCPFCSAIYQVMWMRMVDDPMVLFPVRIRHKGSEASWIDIAQEVSAG